MLDDDDMVKILREECDFAGSQKNWAAAHGFSPQFVTDVLHGRRMVSDNIANALGYDRHVSYRKRPSRAEVIAHGDIAKALAGYGCSDGGG